MIEKTISVCGKPKCVFLTDKSEQCILDKIKKRNGKWFAGGDSLFTFNVGKCFDRTLYVEMVMFRSIASVHENTCNKRTIVKSLDFYHDQNIEFFINDFRENLWCMYHFNYRKVKSVKNKNIYENNRE